MKSISISVSSSIDWQKNPLSAIKLEFYLPYRRNLSNRMNFIDFLIFNPAS